MKQANDNSPNVTNLKPCDHQAFFEALDFPPLPTEALRAAFRRQKESFVDPGSSTPTNE
ncbi:MULTISPECIES: DUF1778 domain-containing protein [Rhodobacterales]|uniref:type II toxin -antitoxin system TacA 1-like antitoxin n=1 Tax=Rhodobacterales TaxID=204455 RepID=UPI0012E014B2